MSENSGENPQPTDEKHAQINNAFDDGTIKDMGKVREDPYPESNGSGKIVGIEKHRTPETKRNRQTEITDLYTADRQAEVTTRRHFQDSKLYSFLGEAAKLGFGAATYVGAAELERRVFGSVGSGKDLVNIAQDSPAYAKLLAEQLFAVGAGVANYASLGGKLTK